MLFRRNAVHRCAHLASRWLLAGAIGALVLASKARGQFPPPPVYTEAPPGGMNGLLAPPMQPLPAAPPARVPIRVALPVPQLAPTGELVMQPNVAGAASYSLTDGGPAPAAWRPGAAGIVAPAMMQASDTLPPPAPPGALQWPGEPAPAAPFGPAAPLAPGIMPAPGVLPEGVVSGEPGDLFWGAQEPLVPWDSLGVLGRRQISPSGQPGLGRERVMFAPFFIDITQPFGNFTLRNDDVWHLTKPDRAEYFWAMPGRGPRPEKSVSYQDYRFRLEMGGPAFSVATDIPVRFVNPVINGNNGGLGDISLVTKTRLMDGSRWQMTQILRTIFNSGDARKGLGTGHVAMEPGLLCRYKVSDITYVHSQFELQFPLGGTPMYSGPGFTWGVGVSTIWWETDTFAAMPTLEFVNLWILDGQYTPYPAGPPIDVRGDSINMLAPGLRTVWDTGGDMGVVEFGVSSSFGLGSNGWYNSLLRVDLRFVF